MMMQVGPLLGLVLLIAARALICSATYGSAPSRQDPDVNELGTPVGKQTTNENAAKQWLTQHNRLYSAVLNRYMMAAWAFKTNLTDFNQKKMLAVKHELATFEKQAYEGAMAFKWVSFPPPVRRLFSKVADIGTSVLPPADFEKLSEVTAKMSRMYSVGKVCDKPGDSSDQCYRFDPDLDKILAKSRDWDLLVWAWRGWRNATGRQMASLFTDYVNLNNKAAQLNGFPDAGAYWRASYETENFRTMSAELWEKLKPFYQQLHAYVRRKLMKTYPDKPFPDSRHIPAHILGNMWAQHWNTLGDIVRPFPNASNVDVTDEMIRQGYNVTQVVGLAEDFFTSLGLSAMPESFWTDSMLSRPPDRDVVCHASAWDFYNNQDFRIKQCTKVDMEWLFTTHHEMGHIEYYMEYRDQPAMFKDGANPGFHEAIGDIMELSVSTPEHLHQIRLLPKLNVDQDTDLNFLLEMALRKVAFLPFGYLIDQWRWDVFSGKTTPENYNRDWWKLRCSIQGVAPPVSRSGDDFDPGAKYHIPASTPYIRYFIAGILQFQIHKGLCEASGNRRPLHRCDNYRSRDAGNLLSDALRLGSSVPWPEVLRNLTGSAELSVDSLLEYFRPLRVWLEEQNEGHDVTWQPECPDGSFVVSLGAANLEIFSLITAAGIISFLFTSYYNL